MRRTRQLTLLLLPIGILIGSGCDKDELAQLAERNLERQAEQNRKNAELQREVASGARQLVAADAEARRDLIQLQQEMQTERAEIGQQRDELEQDRKQIALQRQRDPLIATTLQSVALLAACLLPLLICLLLLRKPPEQADDREVAELLISDLVSRQSKFFPLSDAVRERLSGSADDARPQRLSDATENGEAESG